MSIAIEGVSDEEILGHRQLRRDHEPALPPEHEIDPVEIVQAAQTYSRGLVIHMDNGGGEALVAYKGVFFFVWDNGGEVGVQEVNSDDSRFFPPHWHDEPLNVDTLAYRLICCLRGEEIDYALRVPEVR